MNNLEQKANDLSAIIKEVGESLDAYDAESRITSVDTNGATYTYDADGNRVRKDVSGSDPTEYIYFGGQPIAEYDPNTGDWSDYIYANGKRIAKADSFVDEIFIHGTTCSGCGQQYALFDFAPDTRYTNRVIQSGDSLYLMQWQGASTTHGGVLLWFSDNTTTNWAVNDQYGDALNDSHQIGWYYRKVDLSPFANGTRRITDVQLRTVTTDQGYWDIRFKDIALTAADGTVIPIYNGQSSVSLTPTTTSGMSGVGSGVTREHSLGIYPTLTTKIISAPLV